MNGKRVVAYVRESKHANAEECLERQAQSVQEYCQKKGYNVCETVCAIGSRKDCLENLKKAVETAKNTNSKLLVMASVNRIVNTPEELHEVEAIIGEAGITIETPNEKIEDIQAFSASIAGKLAKMTAECEKDVR